MPTTHNIRIRVHPVTAPAPNPTTIRLFSYLEGADPNNHIAGVSRRRLVVQIDPNDPQVAIRWTAGIDWTAQDRELRLIFEEWPFAESKPSVLPPYEMGGTSVQLTLDPQKRGTYTYTALVRGLNDVWLKDDPDIEIQDETKGLGTKSARSTLSNGDENTSASLVVPFASGLFGGAVATGALLALARRRQKVRREEG
jgi:hypothetical protein